MTSVVQGGAVTSFVTWREYPPDGPLIDLLNVQLTITNLASGGIAFGPSSIGVTNPTTGLNGFTWNVPANQPTGAYVWLWTGEDPAVTGSVVSASEVIDVVGALEERALNGPCVPWTPIWNCTLSPEAMAVTGTALAMATEVLYALSGQRFGMCELTIRPCRRSCFGNQWPFGGNWWDAGQGMYPRPWFFDGVWYNLTCGSCGDTCSCTVVETAWLPSPIAEIVQVKVDGVILDPSAYRVDDWHKLIRLDGGQWPICNNLNLADTEVGTWSVTALFGEPVPVMGRAAVGELAAQFAKLLACDDDCQLPPNVTSVARQGVDMTLLDPNQIFANGRIGLYLSDLFLTSVDPRRALVGAQVVDVDGDEWTITGTSL